MPATRFRHPYRFALPLATLTIAVIALGSAELTAQTTSASGAPAAEVPYPRWQVGSSMFMAMNALPDPPNFVQFNAGYRVTNRDVVSLEAITWTYERPLGIPWGPSFDDKLENYPGDVRSVGVGVAYQRFLWRGAYAAAHALPLLQQYRDPAGREIQKGFQLFTTLRAGYHVPLFRKRWFIEPSIAMTAWPVNTNVPDTFAARDRKWSKYFLAEPGLHFGMRF